MITTGVTPRTVQPPAPTLQRLPAAETSTPFKTKAPRSAGSGRTKTTAPARHLHRQFSSTSSWSRVASAEKQDPPPVLLGGMVGTTTPPFATEKLNLRSASDDLLFPGPIPTRENFGGTIRAHSPAHCSSLTKEAWRTHLSNKVEFFVFARSTTGRSTESGRRWRRRSLATPFERLARRAGGPSCSRLWSRANGGR